MKLLIEEIEREEAALRDDLYSADRKFAEYYNVHATSYCKRTLINNMLNLCVHARARACVCACASACVPFALLFSGYTFIILCGY